MRIIKPMRNGRDQHAAKQHRACHAQFAEQKTNSCTGCAFKRKDRPTIIGPDLSGVEMKARFCNENRHKCHQEEHTDHLHRDNARRIGMGRLNDGENTSKRAGDRREQSGRTIPFGKAHQHQR